MFSMISLFWYLCIGDFFYNNLLHVFILVSFFMAIFYTFLSWYLILWRSPIYLLMMSSMISFGLVFSSTVISYTSLSQYFLQWQSLIRYFVIFLVVFVSWYLSLWQSSIHFYLGVFVYNDFWHVFYDYLVLFWKLINFLKLVSCQIYWFML